MLYTGVAMLYRLPFLIQELRVVKRSNEGVLVGDASFGRIVELSLSFCSAFGRRTVNRHVT